MESWATIATSGALKKNLAALADAKSAIRFDLVFFFEFLPAYS